MKIKFIQDFGGKETNEVHYKNGEIIDVPNNMAERLISDGRAIFAEGHGITNAENTPQFEEVPASPEVPQEKKFKRGRQ